MQILLGRQGNYLQGDGEINALFSGIKGAQTPPGGLKTIMVACGTIFLFLHTGVESDFSYTMCNNGHTSIVCCWPGRVAQSVTCLATDACLTANPGVASSIPVRSHTFVEIDHEMISTVILLPSADSFKKGCCQLQAKLCARSTC